MESRKCKEFQNVFKLRDITEFKLHLAKSNGLEEPYDVMKRDFEEWQGWNEHKGIKNRFNRPKIFTIIKVPGKEDTYTFGGIFRVENCYHNHYDVSLCNEYVDLIGNTFVDFHISLRGSSFILEHHIQRMKIK